MSQLQWKDGKDVFGLWKAWPRIHTLSLPAEGGQGRLLCIYLIHVEQEERSSLCVTGSTSKTDIGGGGQFEGEESSGNLGYCIGAELRRMETKQKGKINGSPLKLQRLFILCMWRFCLIVNTKNCHDLTNDVSSEESACLSVQSIFCKCLATEEQFPSLWLWDKNIQMLSYRYCTRWYKLGLPLKHLCCMLFILNWCHPSLILPTLHSMVSFGSVGISITLSEKAGENILDWSPINAH